MDLLHIGFGNIVSVHKVVSIINPETSTGKRIRESSRKSGVLIDCTMGRKIRAMVLTDSQYTFLSCISPEALLQRMRSNKEEDTDGDV